MTNARRVSTLLLTYLGIACFVILPKDWGVAAMAATPGGSGASGFWESILFPAGAVLALVLIAALIPLTRRLIGAAGYRKSTARFLMKAEGLASGERAIAVVSVPDLNRLPAKRGKRAMGNLRLYLESFVQKGELSGRLDRFAYGLYLTAKDSEAFAQRLEILKQDVGFLYMAAYPGMRITARVTACRESGQGLKAALDSALSRNAPEGPDQGLD